MTTKALSQLFLDTYIAVEQGGSRHGVGATAARQVVFGKLWDRWNMSVWRHAKAVCRAVTRAQDQAYDVALDVQLRRLFETDELAIDAEPLEFQEAAVIDHQEERDDAAWNRDHGTAA